MLPGQLRSHLKIPQKAFLMVKGKFPLFFRLVLQCGFRQDCYYQRYEVPNPNLR